MIYSLQKVATFLLWPPSQLAQIGHIVSLRAICTCSQQCCSEYSPKLLQTLTMLLITSSVLLLTIFLSQSKVSPFLLFLSVNSTFTGFSKTVSSWSWWNGAYFFSLLFLRYRGVCASFFWPQLLMKTSSPATSSCEPTSHYTDILPCCKPLPYWIS